MKSKRYRIDLYLLVAVIALMSVSHYRKPDAQKTPGDWFPSFDFDPAAFKNPSREFGPFTRWWLPGNDIDSKELEREISMFADNGFAGVEVQPFTMGLKSNAPQEQLDRINSWDTPSYYEHLKDLMRAAKKEDIVVDMNAGSGWPMGGPFVSATEGMKTLAISDTLLNENSVFNGLLPLPQNHDPQAKGMLAILLPRKKVSLTDARLLQVTAGRISKSVDNQTVLEKSSLIDLTSKVQDKKLQWKVPAKGKWAIIASWMIPTGESPTLVAGKNAGYVTDALDPASINKTYEHLFGSRTGLIDFYQQPLRAVFNDSYEYHTDRLISDDFLNFFKTKNGYDIGPYLSTVFVKGYNHPAYLSSLFTDAKPPFVVEEAEGWRMMYDYNLAMNELFRNKFIRTSNTWMQKRGMLHRNQAYGFPCDVIGNAGAVDIPEAEQLFAEGSEGYLKLVSSGAHLNNKPVITQESFVSIFRSEMTTPQKIKIWADKSFASGINQLIYHGTPYRYNQGEFGWEGWAPFSSPYSPFVNFSTGMNESDPFWKYIRQINTYLTRCQYALRSGKPKTDVLIYMPFIDFTENQIALNPQEILYRGFFEGVEPDVSGFGVFTPQKTQLNAWYTRLWDIVNELEKKGITWEFVNDEALQRANISGGQIRLEDKSYKTLILAHLPYMPLGSAKKINELTKAGMSTWFFGELPKKQPSYLNYKENDMLTSNLIEAASKMQNSRCVTDVSLLPTLNRKIFFLKDAPFSRMITREMSDSSQIRFIWNKSGEWQNIRLQLNKSFSGSYWLNPESGSIQVQNGNTLSYDLPPYGSVILYASAKKLPEKFNTTEPETTNHQATPLMPLNNWSITAGGFRMSPAPLADWRTLDSLKYALMPAVYSTVFRLGRIEQGKKYFVDLGQVYFTAEIKLNGKLVSTRLFAPYAAEITSFIKQGENQLEVTVTPTRRNAFIGEANRGNPQYAHFKGKNNTLLPAGLTGPAVISVK